MIAFDRVSKRFDDGTIAVDEVSLEVPAGQLCVLLGHSGAGKSTLLRTVNGMVEPSGGSVHIDGVRVEPRSHKQLRRQIGMIHQQFELVDRLGVLHNVLCGALPAVSTLASLFAFFPTDLERRACALLHDVELGEEHLYRRASTLSGGQQQRVAIARAFILSPRIVLADEPVASLDPTTSRAILELLARVCRRHQATVLCSLHQLDLARDFADRIVALRDGRVIFDGPPDTLDEATASAIYAAPEPPADLAEATP